MPLTSEQWDDIVKARISDLLGAGVKADMAIRQAHESMLADGWGPRPDKEPEEPKAPQDVEPPWWARLALRVTVGKGDKGMAQRIIVSLVYAISAMVAAFQAGGMPSTPEGWIALVMAGVIAFWGKFSSNTTIVAANRAPWADAERKADALDQLNKGL